MKPLAFLSGLLVLFVAPPLLAQSYIDTLHTWNGTQAIASFGVTNTATYGQTITVLPGTGPLSSFSFQIGNCSAQVDFRGEIFAFDTATRKATGPSLFESNPMSVAAGATYTLVTVSTGSLQLAPGTYVLAATTSRDQTVGTACRFGSVTNNQYGSGQFVFLNNGTDTTQWTTATWSTIAADLAFRATFRSSVDTISNWNGTSFISNFGVPNTATYGQTITVLPGTGSLKSFSFEIGNCSARVDFRGEIFAYNPFTNMATGTSLFEGPVMSVPAGASYSLVTINTGSLALVPGIYVLFASTSRDQSINTACRWGALQTDGVYTGGRFVFLNNGNNPAQWTATTWSTIAQDLAFRATFEEPFSDPWHGFFAVDTLETPMVGDFNGDGKTDIITFTRQNPLAVGDVYVAVSNGSRFTNQVGAQDSSDKWQDWFAITTDETVVIGDYDGDGKDDIATWLGKSTKQVYVAISNGTGMGAESVWLSSIGLAPSDVLLSGDVNGDGKKDLVLFARQQGKVYVALSTGTAFQAPTEWHGFFAVSTYERPQVADVNGDGKADIVTFATDSPTAFGDVYVALSNGTQFVDMGGIPNSSTKWHDFFAIDPSQRVRIGDANADNKSDFFTFLPPPFAQAYVVQSTGTAMGPNVLWPAAVAPAATDVPFVGDVNGDGKADIIVFAQATGKVNVSLGQ